MFIKHTNLHLLLYLGTGLFLHMPQVHAMDIEPQKEDVNSSLEGPGLLQMPAEVLEHILKFVIENNPDALGNLIKIQQTCKHLAGLLSAESIKQIMNLTQAELDKNLYDAIVHTQSKNLRLWFKLGARWNPNTSILEETLLHGNTNIHNGTVSENGLLQVIFVLTERGIGFNTPLKGIIHHTYSRNAAQIFDEIDRAIVENVEILSPLHFAIYKKWLHIAKYFIKHGAKVDSNSLKIATWNDDPLMVQLLLTYGANPNEGANPPLINAQSSQVASLLLNAGAKLFISCDRMKDYGTKSEEHVFSMLVWQARRTMDPSILIEALKPRYSLTTATAIAFAIVAGAPYMSAVCNIL